MDDVIEDDEDCRHHGGGSVSLPLLPPTGGEMEEEERVRIEPIIPLLRTIRDAAIWTDIMVRGETKRCSRSISPGECVSVVCGGEEGVE